MPEATLPLQIVYKDGDCWRPVTKDMNTTGREIGYLIMADKMPIKIEFGQPPSSFIPDSKGNFRLR